MANNTRQYSIVINGVEQSIKAVDALLQKIDALDERIQKLQKLNIDLGAVQNSMSKADSGSSKYDAAKSEVAVQKEIADQIALQNAENQKALQLLVQKKQETKEQVKIQQQIAQGVRDTNGEYANTLNGQRALLSEMKKQIGSMDIDDAGTKAFAEEINKVTEKIKEMEEAYGTFTRNVGNYKSAAEGFQGFNITIGETVRNFGSLREAAKTIKNEMMGIDTSTAEGRAQFEAYSQALHDVTVSQAQMADAADRAASSSKGLHDALEMMEGLTAITGIGQGVSSLFGIDSSEIGEQITKLQSLMTIMQSIKTLQDQMERGVGGGGWIAKLWKGLDHPIASLKKLSAGLKTAKSDITAVGAAGTAGAAGMTAFSAATTTATVALKAFAKATVILFVLQLLAEAVDLLIEGFKKLGSWIYSLFSDSNNAANAISNVGDAAESAADALDAYNEQLSRQVQSGLITSAEEFEKAMAKLRTELGATTHELVEWFNAMNKDFQGDANGLSLTKTADDAIDNLKRVGYAFDDMDHSTEEFKKKLAHHGRNIVREMAEMGMQSREELAKFVEALQSDSWGRNALKQMMDELPEKSRESFQAILDNFYSMANQMASRAAQLQNEINSSLANLEMQYLNNYDQAAAIRKKWDEERKKYQNWNSTMGSGLGAYQYQQAMQWIDANEKAELNRLAESEKQKNKITTNGQASRLKATKLAGSKRVSAAKNTANLLEQIEKRIQNDKIQAMREGLGKTLAQLDLERRNRIEQAKKTREELGKNNKEAQTKYEEELLSIKNLYNKKEFDAKKEWADKWENYQRQVMKQIEQGAREYNNLVIELLNNTNQNWFDKKTMDIEVVAIKNLVRQVAMADEDLQKIIKDSGLNELLDKYLKEPTEDVAKEIETILNELNLKMKKQFNPDGSFQYKISEIIDDEEYYRTLNRINEINKEMLELTTHLKGELDLDAIEKKYRALEAEQKKLYESFDINKMSLANPEELFNKWKIYYDMMYRTQKQYAEKVKEVQLEQIGYNTENALFDENESYDDRIKDIEKQYGDHLKDLEEEYDRHIAQMQEKDTEEAQNAWKHAEEMKKSYGAESEEYHNALVAYYEMSDGVLDLVAEKNEKIELLEEEKNGQIEWFTEMHNLTIKRIEENAAEQRLKVENDFQRESQTATANYYSGLLNEFQVYQNKYTQKLDKLTDKSKNAWGILNLNAYTKGINNLKGTFSKMVDDLEKEQTRLILKLANKEISLGDFNTAYNELEDLKEQAKETIETLDDMGKNRIGEFIDSINQYIQTVGQGVQELLSTVWDAQSAALDAQQEALEKANSELEKQLSKQQEITQRHADKINQIEDELSTARGDRRQHLIDMLSAQIAAQRASLAAEQRIQKQKEANEKKQDALDKKRKEAQRKQDIISAVISTALATANGLATKPFVPVGIAMGALAAALGAAQVAIISSKHYAKGGLLEGPSHSRGGIPVGNTGIEVEGKEYIVNKRSTAANLGLIEYINRSNKRLDMADLMEYFNSAASRSVRGVKTTFADGGELPTLNDEMDIVSSLQTVVVNQDNRPIYVTVRDINNAQENYRNVQVLAGLK